MSQDDVDSLIEGVSGSKITSGISRSKDGLLRIDWDKGTIEISDGAKEIMRLGKMDDGTRGFKLLDSKGNQISVSMIELKMGTTVLPGQSNAGRLFIDRNPNNGKNRLRVQFSTGDPLTIASQL